MNPLTPTMRALQQLTDPAFLGVVRRSVLWALLAFVLLAAGLARLFGVLLSGWPFGVGDGWAHGLTTVMLGVSGSMFVAHLLFLPVAGVIATLYADRIAAAVERRWYPGLPPGRAAPLASQTWDGIVLGTQILGLQLLAFVLSPFVGGLSLPLGWGIAAWAIGRGLAVAVLMRRMDRAAALAAYRRMRPAVLFQGLLATAASLLPIANLLVPVLAVAALTHVVAASARSPSGLSPPTFA